jgi:hypothetical protein
LPSLGASAVLIFAAPHSPFAQPWAVLGGHLFSAVVGIACWQLVPNATLAAVIGGAAVHDLGFSYVVNPIAINCAIILAVGVIFNYSFARRRYPASPMRYRGVAVRQDSAWPRISESHVMEAMDHLNVVIDVEPNEMSEIIRQTLAVAPKQRDAELPEVRLAPLLLQRPPGPAVVGAPDHRRTTFRQSGIQPRDLQGRRWQEPEPHGQLHAHRVRPLGGKRTAAARPKALIQPTGRASASATQPRMTR